MGLTDKSLTSIGLLSGGKLTPAARARFIDETTTLLSTGNVDGTGGAASMKLFSSIVSLPPVPGPEIPLLGNAFWFKPDPSANVVNKHLKDEKSSSAWHKFFLDSLYEPVMNALDVEGATPLFPAPGLFDPSGIGLDIPFPPDLTKLLPKLKIPDIPTFALKYKLPIPPPIPSLPIPPIPPIPYPVVPGLPALPPLVMPDLLLGLIKIPFLVLEKLLLPPNPDLVLNLPTLPTLVLDIFFNLVFDLLKFLGLLLTLPFVLIASILTFVKNVVAALCVDIVCKLIGTGGVAQSIASVAGLI